jgi:hypothetical protein
MEDESGLDEKILAVPVEALYAFYSKVESYTDFPAILCEQIAHLSSTIKTVKRGSGLRASAGLAQKRRGALLLRLSAGATENRLWLVKLSKRYRRHDLEDTQPSVSALQQARRAPKSIHSDS